DEVSLPPGVRHERDLLDRQDRHDQKERPEERLAPGTEDEPDRGQGERYQDEPRHLARVDAGAKVEGRRQLAEDHWERNARATDALRLAKHARTGVDQQWSEKNERTGLGQDTLDRQRRPFSAIDEQPEGDRREGEAGEIEA